MDKVTKKLSNEAQSLLNRILPKIQQNLKEVEKIPVAVLIWGSNPSSDTDCAKLRCELCDELRDKGHAAIFSEEIYDASLKESLRLQQIAHAKEFDLIVSIPEGHGSIGEVHDFIADHRVNSKMLIFLPIKYLDSYSSQSLHALESIVSAQIVKYSDDDKEKFIIEYVVEEAQKIRELKYILGGRF